MSLCNLRTFMVLLVLELATLTQVDTFTIRRAPETTQLPDLIQSENAILEVRNDLRRNAEWKTSTSTETTAGTETQKNVVTEETTVTSAPTNATTITTAQTTSAASSTATPAVSTIQATVATTTEARNTTTTPTTTTTKTTITSITSSTEEPTQETSEPSSSTTETTEHTSETSSVITSSSTTEGTSEATSEDQTQASTNDNLVNQTFSSAKLQNVTVPDLNKTADNSTTVADKNLTIQTTTPSKPETENVTTSSNQNFSTTEEWRTDTDNATSYSTESVDTSSSSSSAATTDATTDTSSSKDIDGTSHKETTDTVKIPTTSSSESETNVTEMTTVTETEGVSTETPKTNQSDGLKADSSGVTATPYWKKYTVIDRKRNATVADPVTSTESDDMVQAGTAQSSVSLEKALNISSDIPSLEELKNELLALNKMTTLSLEKLSSMVTDSPITFSSPEDLSTISSETTSEVTTRLDVVSSKRAGFLDHSSRATIATEKVTSQKADGTTERVQTEKNIPVNKTTPLLAKSSSMASQSQLAEDAINEELMKEEILSDNVEYTQRQRVSTEGSNTLQRQSSEQSSSEGSSEDKLSVKPISAERAKNGGLYTVSPNYKPLKKIEVQPSKQFVRDPDDNSWRIQGLNSLGIVVKANNNNSSKPFTQVLKNKTESELNLLEKYNKDEEPELRERLEKIAEMRKSKKKKINQFGETVYTDYADSAERVTMGSGLFGDVVTTAKEVKEYTTTALPELDYNKQTVTTTMEMDDELETTTITKAKKVIDDYEPDDDEPDYTLPDIDLKKQITIKSRVPPPSPPPSLQTTMRTYLPDRKPTIQYFPPREKPKVVINDYDTDFQRKVNAYTYNDAPMRVTQPLTVTAPSQPSYQFPRNKYDQHRPNDLARPAVDVNKNVYLTQPAPPQYNLVEPEGGNRASYVIKHLRDFIDDAVKTDDSVVTEVPVRGVTSNDAVRQTKGRPPSDYYDYEAQFRKDVLDKFVDNFNQNSERFKVEFPVVYNTSVVHTQLAAEGGQASSAAFMKRLYEDAQAIQRAGRLPKRFEPACERTVELSPAYELHYYVPEEEEKETADPRAPHPPPPPPPHQLYRFRL